LYASNPQFEAAARQSDFQVELLPLHSQLLGGSLFGAFPPLSNMLKFSGFFDRYRFQVTRFPALLSAGMQRHRALQSGTLYALPLDSPIPAFDRYRINALLRVADRFPDRGRMLVTAFRSPATSFAFANAIPGSKLPTCYFASQPPNSTARSAFPLHYRIRFAPVSAASLRLARCSLTCRLD